MDVTVLNYIPRLLRAWTSLYLTVNVACFEHGHHCIELHTSRASSTDVIVLNCQCRVLRARAYWINHVTRFEHGHIENHVACFEHGRVESTTSHTSSIDVLSIAERQAMWICSDAPTSSAVVTVMVAVILLVVTAQSELAPGSNITQRERTEPNGQQQSAGRDSMTQWERTEPNGKRRTEGILSTAGRSRHKDTGGSGEPGPIKKLMSFFEEQKYLDVEVTHAGETKHDNSGESATISKNKTKKQPSLNIEVMRSGDIKFRNNGESCTVTNGPAGSVPGRQGRAGSWKGHCATESRVVLQLHSSSQENCCGRQAWSEALYDCRWVSASRHLHQGSVSSGFPALSMY